MPREVVEEPSTASRVDLTLSSLRMRADSAYVEGTGQACSELALGAIEEKLNFAA
jgi:hypothetical protein